MKFFKILALSVALTALNVNADPDKITQKLAGVIPDNMKIQSIAESEMQGVYLVDLGSQTIFAYENGEHLLVGEAFDTIRQVSLLSEYKAEKMSKSLSVLEESKMIIMGPKDGERYITVFTDIDCGYCRKLHFETIPKLVDAGIKIRYLMWPRAGLNTESYDKAVSAYCAEDQVKALTDAKAGKEIEKIECDNPVAQHFQIGIEGGVRGTPNIVLDNGIVIPGYVPAERILGQLQTAGQVSLTD